MKSCVVIGMGRFGREVSRRLCEFGCEVLAMDLHSELVQQIACVCKSTELDEHSRVYNKRVCKEGPVFNAREVEL